MKQTLRERLWALLEARGVGRFPKPLRDRVPNFVGAEAAAARAAELTEWKSAERLKCNPDAPQRPLRLRALRDGKHVFLAVQRLRSARCFLELDPAKLAGKLAHASTIAGAFALGQLVTPERLGTIDLVVVGAVAVHPNGARLGKGGGYSDLEWALGRELGAVSARTPVLTTVHELQVVGETIPMTRHDVPLDLIVTPERVIKTEREFRKPTSIFWNEFSPDQIEAMPVLGRLRAERPARRSRARDRRRRPD